MRMCQCSLQSNILLEPKSVNAISNSMLCRIDWHGFWSPARQQKYGHNCCGELLKACFPLQAAVSDKLAMIVVQLLLP